MRIALVSDAWSPQVNGVVRTLRTTVHHLRARGHRIETITPDQFATLPCPSYPEIRLALGAGRAVRVRLDALDADAVHIATEGPLGWAARRWCLLRGRPFTTSFHTRFPDYLALRTGLPSDLFWAVVRRFHAPAAAVFAATATLEAELHARDLPRTHRWSRGVDLSHFTPDGPGLAAADGLPRPLLLHVGRVAIEKNIEAFLRLAMPGTKLVVGDGPALGLLRRRYPDVRFLGALHGNALAAAYRSADLLVFPSLTDTFGLVMIEALASGVPVAAYPVAGPRDVLGASGGVPGASGGVLDDDLGRAATRALAIAPSACVAAAAAYDWATCTSQFLAGLQPIARRLAA